MVPPAQIIASLTSESATSNPNHSQATSGAVSITSNPPGSASARSAEKLDAPELRYRILERFKEAFYCDPEAFPVGLSPALARKRGLEFFPRVEMDQETFRAILRHVGLNELTTLSEERKLLVYREFNKLRGAVHLEQSNDQYKFKLGLKEKSGDISIEGLIAQNGTITVLKRERALLTCPL